MVIEEDSVVSTMSGRNTLKLKGSSKRVEQARRAREDLPSAIEARRADRDRRHREAVEAFIRQLKEDAPEVFDSSSPKPLSVGMREVLAARYPEVKRNVVWRALNRWTQAHRYHQAMLSHTHRYDLEGHPAESITEEDQAHARARLEEREERKQARSAGRRRAGGPVDGGAPAPRRADKPRQEQSGSGYLRMGVLTPGARQGAKR